MFKKVSFAIVGFPLGIIDAIISIISILIIILYKFIYKWYGATVEYNDLLESKIDGWTRIRDNLKFD